MIKLAIVLLAFTACTPIALIPIGAAVVSGALTYHHGTSPPNMIHRRTKGQYNDKLVYDDDPRIPGWCADPDSRKKIQRHCEEREARERQLADEGSP